MLESSCAGWTAPPLRLGRVVEAVAVSAGFAIITGTVSGCKFTVPESGAPALGVIFESEFLASVAVGCGALRRSVLETSVPRGAIVDFVSLSSAFLGFDASDEILLPSDG